MIEQLNWDTKFFGYKTGKLILSENQKFSSSKFKRLVGDYKLVYVFSHKKVFANGLKLVDKKITFQQATFVKDYLDKSLNSKIELFNEEIHDYKSLQKLALSSGKYSRFNIDKNFINNEFSKLYIKWIENAVRKEKPIDVLIYRDKEISGFTTIEKKSDGLAAIGLIAVSQKERGKGVASKLVECSIKRAFDLGFDIIQVATQTENTPAIKLYEKCGFKIIDTTYIYHYWNL
jgi:dTDP-4-amino-4,6-dideoxy-D-galactose acyltransferase